MAVNKVILLGNLGANPELKMTANQFPVCNLNIATGERKKDPAGNWVDHTEWHRVVVLGKTAENCAQYLSKGRQVYIEGKLQTRKWQDKEGKDRYTTEILANTVQFIGGAKGAGGAAPTSEYNSENEKSTTSSSSYSTSTSSADTTAPTTAPEVSFDDDDIPF